MFETSTFCSHPPSLPGILARFAIFCRWRQRVRDPPGSRRAKTPDFAAGLFAVSSLAVHWTTQPWSMEGLCPLHQDRKPSFVVDTSKNLFYCYDCGRGGDVIRFAELYHQVRFPQALGLLCQWRGMAPPLDETTSFYLHAVATPRRSSRLSASTRSPVAGTDRAHADGLRTWRLPARLVDAVGLFTPHPASSRSGYYCPL